MPYLWIFLFLLITNNSYASKVFYSALDGKEIIDLSGQKSEQQIREEFGIKGVLQETTLSVVEGHKIENDVIVKYDINEEKDRIQKEQKNEKKKIEDKVKQDLGWNDDQLFTVKEFLKN